MFKKRGQTPAQEQYWVQAKDVAASNAQPVLPTSGRDLRQMELAREVWAICAPAYAAAAKDRRPGIDPVVYLKMLMVRPFENLLGDYAIAPPCADSFSLREFLGYVLIEATPYHSTLSVIRYRLDAQTLESIHQILLRALRSQRFLRGRQLGIDSSVTEANASLHAPESYCEYILRLAVRQGSIRQPPMRCAASVRRGPDARPATRVGSIRMTERLRSGAPRTEATDMIYKPKHVADLERWVIVSAQVRFGEAADCPRAADRVLEAVNTSVEAAGEDGTTLAEIGRLGGELMAENGYFATAKIAQLKGCGVRTVVSDPNEGRPNKKAPLLDQRARSAVKSVSGKALLRIRGQHVERAFSNILDQGELRRETLRGCANLSKRYLMGAFSYNLSLLLRAFFGIETSKQWLAAPRGAILALFGRIWSWSSLHQCVRKGVGRQIHAYTVFPCETNWRLRFERLLTLCSLSNSRLRAFDHPIKKNICIIN